jgi:predicted permease
MAAGLWNDLHFAVRTMRRNPGFTAIAVLTVALGIGANTALFSIVNAVLLKPLPVRNPQELAFMVWDAENRQLVIQGGYDGSASSDYSTTGHLEGTSFPYITFERMRRATDTFSCVFALATNERLNVIVDGNAELASGQFVTGDYYQGLGVRAWRGRLLAEADEKTGVSPAAVITWRYWQRRFRGDASALGRVITIKNVDFTVVGITPPDFSAAVQLDESADVTLPIGVEPLVRPQNPRMTKPGLWWLRIMARLRPGVSREEAQARFDPIFQQSVVDGWNESPETRKQTAKIGPHDYPHLLVRPGAQGDEFARRQYRSPLEILMMVVGLVLLTACINASSLLLAKGSGRQQEFAMRIALGARRSRLMRQTLTESVLLSGIAGIVGCALAFWGKQLLLGWTQWIRGGAVLDASLDLRVLGFAAGISALTGILFGIAPAWRAGQTQLAPNLKVQIGSAGRTRAGKVLIVSQVAISLVLLVGAGLFERTLHNLAAVDVGFNRENLLLFRVDPSANGYNDKGTSLLYDRMLERVNSIPGAQSAALSRHPLLSFTHIGSAVYLSTGNQHNGEIVDVNTISPSFFETMRIPVLLGRTLQQSDTQSAPLVVVVNQAFARAYFSRENPVGQKFWLGDGGEGNGWPLRKEMTGPPDEPPMEIVGVTGDTKYTDLRTTIRPTVYRAYAQSPAGAATFEVRYRGDEASIVNAVRAAVRQMDAQLPIFDVRTQNEQSDESVAEERMFANLSSSMGGLTLLLVAIGLYGILSYSVGRRTREIGVRMALGAEHPSVVAMILRESFALVAVGIVIGLPVAVISARAASTVLSDLLFGIKPGDPFTFMLAIFIMVGISLIAGFIPARRAARVDPMTALRSE